MQVSALPISSLIVTTIFKYFTKRYQARFGLKPPNEMLCKIYELITVCQKNPNYTQKLQKRSYDKNAKPKSYIPGNKVWLNNKYIETKQDCKLKAKIVSLFQVLHTIKTRAYKLKLPKKCKIHNVFYISLLEQDTIRKEQIIEKVAELDASNSEEYEVEAIRNTEVNARKSEGHFLPVFYYLRLWKSYSEEKKTWEPMSRIQYFS